MNAFNDLDDQELVNWAKTDYGAFDVLYRRYVTPVYRYCYARTNNVADAEDITTQTFLACLESIQRYRGQGNFAAWLFRIAHNKCADFYRRTYSNGHHSTNDQDDLMENVPDTDDQTNPEAQSYLREMLDCVARGLPLLTQDRVDAVRLRYWGGLSVANIARVMQRSPASVKMLISRAVADLRERCVTA